MRPLFNSIITLFLAFLMVSTFFLAFHSMDLGQNASYLESEFNLDLYDINLRGDSMSSFEMYRYGVLGMFVSFFLFGFFCFVLGFRGGVLYERFSF